MKTNTLLAAAAIMAVGIPGVASATALARATNSVHIRLGPGPGYAVVGVIPENGRTTVRDCIRGSGWCQVTYRGIRGWAYSTYLTAANPARALVDLSQNRAALGIPTITYQAQIAVPSSETVGAGPVAETVGEAPAEVVVNPPETVETYVTQHPVEPINLKGEVVVGELVPQKVDLFQVPNYQYEYAYVNTVPVLVAPNTRRIVYVYR